MNRLLYLICVFTDFAAFIVVFAVSRGLAEAKVESWQLGVAGAGLSLSAGLGSILGGWLAHRYDGRKVFVSGAVLIVASIGLCATGDPTHLAYLPRYYLLGIGLGCLYPPLMGWLNRGKDAHADPRGASRTLILFCVAWNVGMIGGQLSAGMLFSLGTKWIYGAAFVAAVANVALAIVAARRIDVLSTEADAAAVSHPRAEQAAMFKRLSWIANLGGMFGGSMVIHLLPDLVVAIGIPAERHGELLASWRVVIIATYLVLYRLTFWHYRLSVSLFSQALAAVGLVLMARAESGAMLLAGLALLGQLVGFNYFSGLFYSTAGSAQTRRALAAGIHEATLATGMAVGTFAGGLLSTLVNRRVPYLLAAGVLLVLMVVQAVAWRRWSASAGIPNR